jgi:hypothetical protein
LLTEFTAEKQFVDYQENSMLRAADGRNLCVNFAWFGPE